MAAFGFVKAYDEREAVIAFCETIVSGGNEYYR